MFLRNFLIVILILFTTNLFGQDSIIKNDSILSYRNKLFFNGSKGDMILINRDSLTFFCIVHWKNKYHLTGNFKNAKEDGYWLLFDKFGILRKKVLFLNGEIGMITDYDKKGKIKRKTHLSIPF